MYITLQQLRFETTMCSQVRNKQVTKHYTEKTVKEVWKERLAEINAGRSSELLDFLCTHFQKKVGIMAAVVEVCLLNEMEWYVRRSAGVNSGSFLWGTQSKTYASWFPLLSAGVPGDELSLKRVEQTAQHRKILPRL